MNPSQMRWVNKLGDLECHLLKASCSGLAISLKTISRPAHRLIGQIC